MREGVEEDEDGGRKEIGYGRLECVRARASARV